MQAHSRPSARRLARFGWLIPLLAVGLWLANGPGSGGPGSAGAEPPPAKTSPSKPAWRSLFDGRSLAGWQKTQFGGDGEVTVVERSIQLDFGAPITGVTCTAKELPKTNYELRLEAMKVDGSDFFCGLTFPVGDTHCSFIVGGWGGAVVGLSNIDDRDASENKTTQYIRFDTNKWYAIRVRVTPERIETWIDDKQIVNQEIRGKRVGIRPEVALSRPLGICTFETRSRLRDIQIRQLTERGEDDQPGRK